MYIKRKMIAPKCEAICKTGKEKPCTNKAVYNVPSLGLRCGSHMDGVENKEQYLIKKTGLAVVRQKENKEEDIVVYENVGGQYSVFSNLYDEVFEHRGIKWRSAENAIQGLRFYWEGSNEAEMVTRMKLVRQIASVSSSKARELGAAAKSRERPDWTKQTEDKYTVKERFLLEILLSKFKQGGHVELLLSTKDAKIVVISNQTEDNANGVNLGEILMLARSYLCQHHALSRV